MKNYKNTFIKELEQGRMFMREQFEEGDVRKENVDTYVRASEHLEGVIRALFDRAVQHYNNEERGTDKYIAKQVAFSVDTYLNIVFFTIHDETDDTQQWRNEMNRIFQNIRLKHEV